MHTFKSFSVLAIAGSALAAPFGGYWGDHGDGLRAIATATETATAYTTVTAASFYQAPAVTTTPAAVVTTPAAPTTSAFFYQPQQQNTYYSYSAPAAAPSSSAAAAPAASPAASSGDSGYMSVVNEWRSKMGLGTLTQDATLQANDQKTVNDDQGTMTHELNPGSMAQVLAPGDQNSFENVFVGGWLCEEPNASGMDGICATMSAGWDYEGQTGHAEILRNPGYTKIGCAWADGLWGCDLA